METLLTENIIALKRKAINDTLCGSRAALIAALGPCAPDINSIQQLLNEAHGLDRVIGATASGIVVVNRLPIWKPRSDPASWQGINASHPEAAEQLIGEVSKRFGMAGIEIGLPEHIETYAHNLAFAWMGARNIHKSDLLRRLASSDPTLPIGVKNGLDGNLAQALAVVEVARSERGEKDGAISLIFRGGANAQDPKSWEEAYIEALRATNGNMIVDVAHGGEMAHSPDRDFTKSVIGQIACYDHVIELARDGYIPAGVLCEASDTVSLVDPVIPFDSAINRTLELAQIIQTN